MQHPSDPGTDLDSLNLGPALRDCLVTGLLAVDSQQRICALNDQACQLVGLSPTIPLPAPLNLLPAPLATLIQHALASGQPGPARVLSLPAPGPASNQVLFSILPAPTPSGPNSILATLLDLRPANRLDQEMQQLNRLASVGTLSASMAHEIKNALVAIKTFVELLLKHHQDSELAGVVSREVNRIDSIVRQMLSFAGPAKPTFAPLHLHQVVNHCLRLLQHQTEGRKIRLSRAFNAAPDIINGDSYQLEQAFVNLLLNAIEATPPNGEITVTTDLLTPPPDAPPGQDKTQVRARIRDKGVGIAAENLEKVFEPFFTTKPNGVGLGLSITRRIVRDHRGSITVDSQPHQGATFSVHLPLLQPSPPKTFEI